MESLGEGSTNSAMGRNQCARKNGHVSIQDPIEEFQSLTVPSWSEIYKGKNGSEAVVRRFVMSPCTLFFQASAYFLSVSRR